jgi:menaquinone-dependent protoporphyrinogen oxidase
MTKRALLLCSSTDGQTRRICERLCRILEGGGAAVTLTMIEDAKDVAPADFDLAVVGARIRYGRTDARVIDFARRHAATLDAMPNAYFSVNIVARKPGKDRPETNPYVRAFLKQARWCPRRVEVFAGRLDYPRYGVFDRFVIRLIMRMTGGPTRPDTVIEYTDWQRVEAFGRALCADLAGAAIAAAVPPTGPGVKTAATTQLV